MMGMIDYTTEKTMVPYPTLNMARTEVIIPENKIGYMVIRKYKVVENVPGKLTVDSWRISCGEKGKHIRYTFTTNRKNTGLLSEEKMINDRWLEGLMNEDHMMRTPLNEKYHWVFEDEFPYKYHTPNVIVCDDNQIFVHIGCWIPISDAYNESYAAIFSNYPEIARELAIALS